MADVNGKIGRAGPGGLRRNPGLVHQAMGVAVTPVRPAPRCDLACEGSEGRTHRPVCDAQRQEAVQWALRMWVPVREALDLGACRPPSIPPRFMAGTTYAGHRRSASRLVVLENMAGLVLLWPAILFPAMNRPHPPAGSEASIPRGPGSCTPRGLPLGVGADRGLRAGPETCSKWKRAMC